MKIHCCVAFLLLFNLQFAFCQNALDELLAKGIEAHDKGEYQTAIDYYKKALAIDNLSGIIFYELALSSYHLKDYKNTVKYADKALKITKEEEILLSAYLVKGAALDDSGNMQKSIKVYNEAIKVFPENYLLHYNLGLTYFKNRNFDDTDKTIQKAIELNPFHGSSHFLLGQNALQKGLRLQSVMAFSQFLFLENLEHPLNITPRSKSGYDLLKEQALNSVTRDGGNSININLMVNEGDEFQVLNTILALMAAQDRIEADSLNLSENQRIERFFYTVTGMISSNDFDKTSFWGKHYASFFKKLSDKDQVKTYAYVILLSHKDDNIIDWINKNTEEIGIVEELLLEHTKAIKENLSPRN